MHASRLLAPSITLALLVMLISASGLLAQATTGSLSGTVAAQEDQTTLPGAQVTATHTPTGTRYTAISDPQGRFRMLNVRVGGPYHVTVAMDGFRTLEKRDALVQLGEDTFLGLQLQLASIEETVVVVAESSPLINPGRTGAASSVGGELVESLPTVNRSIVDLARTNPFFATWQSDDNPSSLAVAGRSNRYNNIQIDGAVNNDLFGLAASGTPGGPAETEPISLDAVGEIQLLVSPYDVRQGGFSGGGVNLITKSGSNTLTGTAYYFDRDDGLIGDRDDANGDEVPFGIFADTQYGVSLGGALARDKAFFFVNYDVGDREQPTGFSADGVSGQQVDALDDILFVQQYLIDTYGFDPGGPSEVTRQTTSDKIFGRLDFNLGDSHQLTLRHNFIDADSDRLSPTSFTYELPSHAYIFADRTNSTVAQLNSVFGSQTFNELRVTYQTIRDDRAGATPFPYVRIDDLGPGGDVDLELGTERFSTANALDQDVLEINNDFTILRGDHTFTIGTHNELFTFDNLFIRESFGSYRFRGGLDQFLGGSADEYNYSFSSDPGDPLRSAKFDVMQLGLYAGDVWTVKPNLTVTYGLRVDAPFFPDDPTFNPQSLAFGFRTDQMPDGNAVFSPRVGFNWDLGGEGRQQLRGGLGLFSGRTPYVWLSNQYSNTGIEFTRVQAFGSIPFSPDPNDQPTAIDGARVFTNEIDLVDPDFELPQVLRASLGYDRELGFFGLVGSAEVIYSQTEKDIAYQNLNIVPTGETRAFDGRPLFTRRDQDFSQVILLENTSEGEQLNASLKVERPFRDGWYAMAAYTYGESTSINDGNSSQAYSNWRFVPTTGDPNEVPLGDSNYLVEHRFNAALSYSWNWGASDWGSTVSLFYNHQSGRPFSTTYRNDENGDFEDNDLIYVPNAGEALFVNGDGSISADGDGWVAFNDFVEGDDGLRAARGSVVKRNASFAPWTHTLDFRYLLDIPVSRVKLQVSAEIENLLNLFDSDSGEVRYVSFVEDSPVDLIGYEGDDAINGRPIYLNRFQVADPDARFTTDDLRSRWRAKLGIRITY